MQRPVTHYVKNSVTPPGCTDQQDHLDAGVKTDIQDLTSDSCVCAAAN